MPSFNPSLGHEPRLDSGWQPFYGPRPVVLIRSEGEAHMGLPRPSVMFVVLAVGLAGLLGVSPGATAGPDMSGSVARVAAVGTYRIGGVTDRWAKRLRNAIIYLLNHADCPYEVIGETCS